jgi:competence protein ComFC
LNSKYYFFGDRIFTILANISFRKFSNNFDFPNEVYVIPIDDNPKSTFSHSAILARSMKNTKVKIQYNSLIAKNHIKYAGKSLEFRKRNKRNFKYTGKTNIKVILVDDIITTGLTILEAKNVLENNHCEVLFALTLSDAKLC